MSLLFMDGFDAQDTTNKWVISTSGTGSINYSTTSATRFNSGYSLSISVNDYVVYSILKPITASSQVFIGAAIKHNRQPGQPYSAPFHVLMGDNALTSHLYLVVNSVGSVVLYRGDGRSPSGTGAYAPNGTQLQSSIAGAMDTNWHYVEMSATISAGSGTVIVKVDGNQVINFTGITKNGGTNTTVDTICYSGMSGSTSFPGLAYQIGSPTVDDLYVCNSLGSVNNTFLGDVRVQTLMPSGAGSSTQFTPTGSANSYANVNEIPDNTSTYNSSSTVGQRDTYAMGDLLANTGQIFAVQSNVRAFKPDAGTANVKPAYKSGASVYYDASQSIGTSVTAYTAVRETDPLTSVAYTPSTINAIEFGAEVA